IADILDFSKIEAGRLEVEHAPVSVRDLVEGLCDSLVPVAASQNVQLSLFVSPDVPEQVHSDEVRIRQVLYNIVGNGIKFSRGRPERRGRVSVRVEHRDGYPARLDITIRDNGVGMGREVVDRLFMPFSQAEVSTTRRFGGTGLGLTICKRLVGLMGGEIGVSSEPGRGSTFTVSLPVDVPETQPGRTLPDLSGLSCVLVDSDAYDMQDLSVYLRHAGAGVQRAASPAAAHALGAAAAGSAVIIDYLGTQPSAQVMDECEPPCGWLHITSGRPSGPEIDGRHVYLDETSQRMKSLLDAVALAGGRVPAGEAHAIMRPPEPVAPAQPQAPQRDVRILVAEDDEISSKVVLQQLERLGYPAQRVANGSEALEKWRTGGFGLVLTDLHMPEMDGYSLARQIRSAEAGLAKPRSGPARVPIIALTANALRDEPERARAAGIDEYLTKPIELQHLSEVLSRWLPDSPVGGTLEL
ncbi:MAG TPA: ATP-binding protein, partial [Gammaproteobacteria bacterium]|nr:ATP-binding protein [Gammaproteobacteria bacterium]